MVLSTATAVSPRRRTVRAHRYGIPENTAENVTASSGLLNGATDADGDSLTASLANAPSHGTATVNSDGSFTYTPTTGYTGSDSFAYKVSDGAESDMATVSLTVHGTDTAPTAGAVNYTMLHDQTLTETAAQGVLSNASDANNDPLTATLVSGPSNGTLTLNPDGSFTYTPNAGWTGDDSFTYKVSDGLLTSTTATATLAVTDPNAPVAVADSYSVERNNEYDADASTGVLANDTDADGDTLSATLLSNPSDGTLTFNSDGSFSYVPNANFTGTDSFTYEANDGVLNSSPATVTLTVSSSSPSAADQTFNVLQNTALNAPSGALLLDDSNPDNMTLTAQDVTQPADGSVTVNSNGSFTYTPNSGFTGSDSFTYDLTDGSLTSSPATVSITVNATNTAPTATALNYGVDENTSFNSTDSDIGGVLTGASDTDGDPLLATLVSGPSDGTLQFNLDGSFTYTPNANFYGTDSFQYEAFDGTTYSSPATVTLTVNEDVPSAVNASYSVLPDSTTNVPSQDGVLADDPDDGPDWLTASLVSSTSYGNLTLNSDGSFSYTPGPNFTGSDSFTYEAYNGLAYSAPATVTLTTNPVDTAQAYNTNPNTPLSVEAADGLELGAYDAEGDALTPQLVSEPSHGDVTVNSDGSFTYTPDSGYTGTDSFQYTVSNGSQTAAPATASITVNNDVPLAGDGVYGTPENQSLTVEGDDGVLVNAADEAGASLTAQVVSGPSDGTLQFGGDGGFTYTPNSGFIGADSFTYEASNAISTSDPATVTIYVGETIPETQPNSMPSAVAVADFNGDSYPDVAMADQGLNTVSVYLDNSSGVVSTTPISTTGVGSAPAALAAADFNGDGNQDLAVANSGSNNVSVLLGNGNGTFQSAVNYAVGSDPVAVVAGNFGNGQQDLAVVNKGSNTVSILLGNGNGTFTPAATLTTGSSPTAIAAADFNNDGDLDLVVTNSASNTVSVFLGNGNGTFASALTDAVGTAPMSVTTGDFNGDGNVDLAVANSGSNNVSVLLGNGDGTFQSATNYAVGSDPVAVVAGNFAGAGSYPTGSSGIELAVVNEGSNNLTVLSGISVSGVEYETTLATAPSPRGMALGDFDKDGQLQGVVVAMARPANGLLAFAPALPAAAPGLRNMGFWQAQAVKAITLKPVPLLDPLTVGFNINRKITAAYAQLFSNNLSSFAWVGLAAFASNDVGLTITGFSVISKDYEKTGVPADAVAAKVFSSGAQLLIAGNQALYTDLYWQFLAYAGGGINQINALKLNFPSPNAFGLINAGGADMWLGNTVMFYHEQHDILQPLVFKFIPAPVGRYLSTMAGPLFPTSTAFPKVVPGGNMANFSQRWRIWINGNEDDVTKQKPPPGFPGISAQWKAYVTAWVRGNAWKAGNNPLQNAMQGFIATGKKY